MSQSWKCFARWTLIVVALAVPALFLAAQGEPSGGDTPLGSGQAVILSQESPAPRQPGQIQAILRTAILPMNTPTDPVRVRFQNPVDLERLRKAPQTVSLNAYSTGGSLRGKWEWQDMNEVRFLPASGSLHVGDEVTVRVSGTLPVLGEPAPELVSATLSFTVENFQMGSKVGSEPVTPGSPRFVAFLDSGTRKIGSGPLYLLYDQPVNPSILGASLSATCVGKKLSLHVRRPASVSFDALGVYSPGNILAVSFDSLPPDGAVITLSYPASVDGSDLSTETEDFTVWTEFRWLSEDLEALKSGTAARLAENWRLGFTNPIDASSFLAAFSVTPRPPVLNVSFNEQETEISIHAEFDVGRLYSMKLDPAFTDMLGNRLKEPLSFAFRSQDLAPTLELPATALLLEAGGNRLPVKYRNLKNVEVLTWRFPDIGSYARALESGGSLDNFDMRGATSISIQTSAGSTMNSLYQADFGIGKDPGLKLVEVRAAGRGTEASGTVARRILVQTTNLGVSVKVSDGAVFAWVTRIDNAKPVSGAAVQLFDAQGGSRGSARTGTDGTATIAASEARGSELDAAMYLSASLSTDASVCKLTNSELSGAWQFNMPGAVKESSPLSAALFTDRGAYRPGETVHLKAFIRNLPEYQGAPDPQLVIHDPRGQEALNATASLDAYRGCAWDFDVKEGAPVGAYSVSLSLGSFLASQTFRVEEYRVPTFQVNVTSTDRNWTVGAPIHVKAAATYLKGGTLAGRSFSWRVYRQPEVFAPAGLPGFMFTLERDPSASGTVHDAEGELDVRGETSLTFTPDQPDSYGPMLYIVQASVTDSDRQNYAGRMSRVVHATSLYVGARPPSQEIYRSGETLTFPFVVTDTDGKVLINKQVSVYLDTVSYNQNTMLDESGRATTYNREVLSSRLVGTAVSGASPTDYSLPLTETGHYRVRLEALDDNGRTASTDFPVTVSGKGTVAWPRFDIERIDLVLDKKSYKAGDKVTVVAQSPFDTAQGLLTVEANGVLDRYVFTIKKDTPSVTFPVRASYAPNAYVSVVLVRGRVHWAKDATGFETGAPAYRIGYARLEVDPAAQRIAISMDQKSLTAKPGQAVTFSFTLKNAAGKPTDASATVMVVDEAVLGLTGYTTPDPIGMAYAFRVLAVRNGSNLLDLPHSRRARFEVLFPGGDSDISSRIAASDDVLRKLFKSTAYYNPAVPVGPDGKGSVSFTLPDNLTTYRIMVVAANKNGQMGSTQAPLLTRKDLAVEPVMPRFVYEGDTLVVEARVFNSTPADGTATVSASFTGFSPIDKPAPVRIVVKKGGSVSVPYRVTVPEGGAATVKFSAVMGSLTDAVEYSIPVRVRGNTQMAVRNAIISGSGTVVLPLPPRHTPGTVEVVLSSTPLSELKDSIQYLMRYPNGCIEQTTSTAYPLVVLKDLLPSIGVQVSEADLKKFSEAGVARILSFQVNGGGLSYWPGGTQPHAFATAFGLTALLEAKKRGYDVPDEALKGMGDFLESSLKSGQITGEMPHASIPDGDTRALFVMTLVRLGRPQSAMISTLWQARDKLTPFGLAFLAIAVKESKGDQSLLQPILAAIRKAATEKPQEAWFDKNPAGGYSFDSPLRTDAGTLVAYAIANTDPGMSQKLLKGLLSRRRGGLWGNTQENVFGIMGIYSLVSGAGASAARPAGAGLTVTINGKPYAGSAFEKNSIGVLRLSLPETSLGSGALDAITVQVTGADAGSSYVTVRGTYQVPIDTALLGAQSQGFHYTRTYETIDGKSLEGKIVPLGTLVRVRLDVDNDSSRHYVAVDDLLPSGFEPLNTSLATTQSVDMGTLSDMALRTQSVVSYSEVRDHRVAFYADELTAGSYEFIYLARATTSGTFFRPVGRAEAMYAPDQFGTTGGGTITIK